MKNNAIIQFSGSVSERKDQDEPVWRIAGLVPLRYITKMISQVSLKANPREAKQNSTVEDIIKSIKDEPSLFHYKNKGILISSESLKVLDRKGSRCRCQLDFTHEEYEGVLDGGHTTFAIGKFILGEVLGSDSPTYKKIKTWAELKSVWHEHIDLIDEMINAKEQGDDYIQPFLIPVEILYRNSRDMDLRPDSEEYQVAIYEIACARNNNTQLTEQSKENKFGTYDIIKDNISEELNSTIAWRSNETDENGDKKYVPASEIIAFSLVPLSRCETEETVTPSLLYNGKKAASQLFAKIVKNPTNNQKVISSAMQHLDSLVDAYEYLYAKFPDAYNSVRPGFGQMTCVKTATYSRGGKTYRRKIVTRFKRNSVSYNYPHAFILPIFWSLSALLKKTPKSYLRWSVEPKVFLARLLGDKEFMKYYTEAIREVNYNPNSFAKRATIYDNITARATLILMQEFESVPA